MKALLTFLLFAGTLAACGQGQTDKSKRPSPPAVVKETLNNGATITIDYSRPSVKGRTIGVDLEPLPGKVWRTGANEATVFETNKDIQVQGKPLAAGKYGLFSIANGDEWTIIFNKTWNQWGAYNYKEADDVLRVTAKARQSEEFTEQFTITVSKDGKVTFLWGKLQVEFFID
jgi:hypothetical protein